MKNVAIGTEKYGEGYECSVTFQIGDLSYNNVTVKLTPEATREVVEMAIARAAIMLAVVDTDVVIAGEFKPLPMIAQPEPPEFAEVDEYVAPAAAPDGDDTLPTPVSAEESI
ncbi:hypothetical protein [Sphingomonas sp. Root50]|uniref:hypothetical protein n=1 Tax=Sphingomonas sp. Root50 TaxID=1736551 RepID=UPI0012E3EF95|nr:hypothetical protein [Sphingomonas sp. Root50]